jgi:hypothetical protein
MRELLKKAGSLALGLGALSLVLFHAAVNHGCGGSRAEPAAQAGPEPAVLAPSSAPPSPAATANHASASAPSASPDPDCERPSYMHATKAPVFVPEKCRPAPGGKLAEPAVPSSNGNNAPQQQAP